jgi:hypothetical protein
MSYNSDSDDSFGSYYSSYLKVKISIHVLFPIQITNKLPTIDHYALLYYYDCIHGARFERNQSIEILDNPNKAKELLANKYLKKIFANYFCLKLFEKENNIIEQLNEYDGNIEQLNIIIPEKDRSSIINEFKSRLEVDILNLERWPLKLNGFAYAFDDKYGLDLLNCIELIYNGSNEIKFNIFYEYKNNTISKKILHIAQMLLDDINSTHDNNISELVEYDSVPTIEEARGEEFECAIKIYNKEIIVEDDEFTTWNMEFINKILHILEKLSMYDPRGVQYCIIREEYQTTRKLIDGFKKMQYLMVIYKKYSKLKEENAALKERTKILDESNF